MGSNNRLPGRVTEIRDGAARLEGDGYRCGAERATAPSPGKDGTAMIRLERIRLAAGPGDNVLEASLTTSMYLGDKWEHLFHVGESRLRAFGATPLEPGRHWLDVPREDLWVF